MEKTVRVPVSFWGWLQLIFITLKLTKYIDWTWTWVLSPIWISAVIVLCISVLVALFGVYKS